VRNYRHFERAPVESKRSRSKPRESRRGERISRGSNRLSSPRGSYLVSPGYRGPWHGESGLSTLRSSMSASSGLDLERRRVGILLVSASENVRCRSKAVSICPACKYVGRTRHQKRSSACSGTRPKMRNERKPCHWFGSQFILGCTSLSLLWLLHVNMSR
jgi:hypothetical protein